MFKGNCGICRILLHIWLFHGRLIKNFIQTTYRLVRLHDRLAHIHDPVDHLPACRSKQRIKNKIDKNLSYISPGSQKQRRRDQEGEGSVDKRQKTGLADAAAHGILTGQIAVIFNSGIKRLERIDRLLKHFHNGNTTDILDRLTTHALNFLLVPMEKSRVLTAHHHTHGKKRQHHSEQAQKSHLPVKKKQH